MAILVFKIAPDRLASLYDGPILNRTAPETALTPVPTEPTPETFKTIPEFTPLSVEERAGKVNLPGVSREPLPLFLLYWPLEIA